MPFRSMTRDTVARMAVSKGLPALMLFVRGVGRREGETASAPVYLYVCMYVCMYVGMYVYALP